MTTAGVGKFTELQIEDVTSVLLNIDGRFFNSIHLSKNWKWQMLSGGFLVALSNSDSYSFNIINIIKGFNVPPHILIAQQSHH